MATSTCPPDVGLIGAGYWGKNLARNLIKLGRLHTICDPSTKVLEQFARDYPSTAVTVDTEIVFGNPGIRSVMIAAPASLHYELAMGALRAGKDVFVEKPLCLDLAEAESLVATAEQHGRILMVGHLLHYHPCIEIIKKMLTNGELGKLQYVTSNRLNLGKFRHEENALWSFAPHDLSVICALAGNTLPDQVRCVGEAYLNQGVCDTTVTTMRFAGGVRAHVFVSWLNPFKEQKLTVVGSQGMAVFDDTLPWPEKLRLHRNYLKWSEGQIPVPDASQAEFIKVEESEPLLEECSHFLHCSDEHVQPRTDGVEGLRVLRVLRAAQESLDQDGAGVSPLAVKQPKLDVPYTAHPTSQVDAGADVGDGTRIWHFSHVSAGARIGSHCNLGQNTFFAPGSVLGDRVKVQNNVSVYGGVVIEDDVFLGPSCVLTNVTNPRSQINRKDCYESTRIRRGATIGANATIMCGITLGRYCFVAAGAVVTKDICDYALVKGVPAKQVGWMSRHGHVLKNDGSKIMTCPESGFRYQEDESGNLKCLDLPEDAGLPDHLSHGQENYHEIRNRMTDSNLPRTGT